MTFDQAFERLIGHEGKFQNHRNDRGNWTSGKVGEGELRGTKFGITAMNYPAIDIKSLTLDDAKALYKRDYWDRTRSAELPPDVAFNVFDAGVHHGVGTAARLLQRAVGVAEDGRIGPITVNAVRGLDPRVVVARLNAHRILLCAALSTWPDFGRGWACRMAVNILEAS
jgi:lysozyme family protein